MKYRSNCFKVFSLLLTDRISFVRAFSLYFSRSLQLHCKVRLRPCWYKGYGSRYGLRLSDTAICMTENAD